MRDAELEAVSKVTVESARAALERKAKVYDKLMKGKSGGLSEKQYEALLVDVGVFFCLLVRSDAVGSLIPRSSIITSRRAMTWTSR